MMRVFLGLDLPEPLRDLLARQQLLLPLPGRVEPDSFHLTLHFMGEQEGATLEAVDDGLSALRFPGFQLSFQGFGLFGGARPHACWAGIAPSAALEALAAKTGQILRQAGCTLPHRKFVPHVTLARFRPPEEAERLRIERAVVAGAGFAAGSWRVQDMVLWQSLLGGKGPKYRELARYPLLPQAGAPGLS